MRRRKNFENAQDVIKRKVREGHLRKRNKWMRTPTYESEMGGMEPSPFADIFSDPNDVFADLLSEVSRKRIFWMRAPAARGYSQGSCRYSCLQTDAAPGNGRPFQGGSRSYSNGGGRPFNGNNSGRPQRTSNYQAR